MLVELISRARAALTENPYDSLHATSHHQQVWDNCLWIIHQEGASVDIQVLQAAAWWHDVERGSEQPTLLPQALKEVGASDEFSQKVMETIGGHSFGQNQDLPEAMVLYDADKLEYLSTERSQSLLRDFESGQITVERFAYYKREWVKRIKSVRDTMHFSSSKTRFDRDLKRFVEFAKSNPQLAEFVSAVV